MPGLRYPDSGSIVSSGSTTRMEDGCGGKTPTRASVTLSSPSLFSGLVSARRVALFGSGAATIAGLTVDGRRVVPHPGRRVPLGGWGYLRTGTGAAAREGWTSALSIHVLAAHAGLPAGTVVLVAAARKLRVVATRSAGRRLRALHEPLKVTPPLGLRDYVFPVAGQSAYVDTYGAYRSDVAGNWHHGDDIFANLGTPVVAVSNGTINRVGWEKLGGWRLWVRDPYGDEFYYAHLSGYAPSDFRSKDVRAGQVIGFVGDTGDAFTTAPHLHFEIHPRQLLHLGYDGAVDPTRYLDQWAHLEHVRSPTPVHPPFPTALLLEREAHYVFRELLAARHLIARAPKASERPHVTVPTGANGPALPLPTPERAVAASSPAGRTPARVNAWLALVLAAAAGALGATALIVRRRR